MLCNSFTAAVPECECHTSFFYRELKNLLSNSMSMAKKSVTCEFCDKKFRYPCEMHAHTVLHTGEKPFKCHVCKRAFARKQSLEMHFLNHEEEGYTRTHTLEELTPYSCEICYTKFTLKTALISHMRVHTGEKIYAYDESFTCQGSQVKPAYMVGKQQYVSIQVSDKPHICNICYTRFKYHISLLHHMRCHTGEKPFYCNTCEQRFAFKAGLVKHLCISKIGKIPYMAASTVDESIDSVDDRETVKVEEIKTEPEIKLERDEMESSDEGKLDIKIVSVKTEIN